MDIRGMINTQARAVENIPESNYFFKVVDKIRNSSAVVTTGVGKAGIIAELLAKTLCSVGKRSIFLDPLAAAHGDVGMVSDRDLVIALSNSGETRELVELFDLTPGMCHWTLITGDVNSFLAQCVDDVLWTGGPSEVCPLGLVPTTSTTVMSVICDVLVCKYMQLERIDRRTYAKFHHGGYIGEKARAVA